MRHCIISFNKMFLLEAWARMRKLGDDISYFFPVMGRDGPGP